jgi:hypothetical protein
MPSEQENQNSTGLVEIRASKRSWAKPEITGFSLAETELTLSFTGSDGLLYSTNS